MAVVFLVLAVAIGLGLWYIDVRQQAQTQLALEQTRDAFERFERERKGMAEPPSAPSAAAPAAPAPPRERAANPVPKAASGASPGNADAQPEIYYLLIALLLTALVALALAVSSYRLVRRERRARMDDDRVMRETVVERSPVFRASEGTIIDAEPVETVADGTPVYSPEPPPPGRELERLRDWVELSPMPVVLMQPSGEVEAVNRPFTHLTGYTATDLPNLQTWLARVQRIPADRQPAARDALRDRYASGADAPVEMTVWTRAGEPLHWLVHTAVYRAHADETRWLMLGTDITARKEAENAAVERAEQARHEAEDIAALYGQAPVGLAVLDRQFRFVRINEKLAQMTGLRSTDPLGKPLRKVLPHVAAAAEPLLERVLHSGAPAPGTWIAVRTPASPKSELHWAVACTPLKDAAGRVTRIAFSAEDVTDRHAAEAHTRENETALRAMFEHLPAPICVKDTQGRYLYANPAYEAFVQVGPGQLRGKMDHEVLPWEAADRLHDADEEALSADRAIESAGTVDLRNTRVDYAAAKVALRDEAGKPYAVCGIYTDWTAQQQAARDVQAAEARYRAIFESSPQPMLIDRDNRLMHVNAACARLLGARDPQQLAGKSILEFIQQPGQKPLQECVQRVLRRKPADAPLEVKVVRLDGTVIDAEIEAALYETGTERAVQILVRDVTERKRADAALRESEARLRRATEDVPALIRLGDAADEVTYWNGHWRRHTGLGVEQGLGRRWTELVHADDRERVARALQDIRAQRGATHIEYRLRDRSGAYRWVLDVVTPRYDDAGAYLGHIACASDVHERKRVEDALQRDATQFRAVAERAPALLWIESDGRVELVNAFMRQSLGISAAEAAEWPARIHPDDRARYDDARSAALREQRIVQAPLRLRHADGAYRDMLATLAPAAAGAGAVVGSLTDVTELRAAQAAAEEADQRRNIFVAALAADMRTPLEPLRHAAEVLSLTARAEPAAQEASDIVVRQAQYLARLLEDTADASELLARPLSDQPTVTDLGDLVHAASGAARPLIEARGQSLTLSLTGGRVPVRVDARRVIQALARLLDFCAQHAGEGERLSVAADEADGDVLVHVTASGIALPEAEHAALFDLYAPASDDVRRWAGITLPLVQRLLDGQGGKVSVERAGEGTRFTVRLPVYQAARSASAQQGSRSVNGHRRVLVVDRDPDTAASLRMLLQLQGHDVRIAQDRAAAVPAAQEFHPDTVLIDSGATSGAPGELVRALRLLPETAHAALLCLAVDGAGGDPAQEGLFDHYLVKPVEPNVLKQVLAQTSPTLH